MNHLARLVCIGITTVSSMAYAQVQYPPPGGYTVDDVVLQFGNLAHHPDPISVGRGAGQDSSLCKHYQGIARYDLWDGTPYLIMSRSGQRASCAFCGFDCSDDPGELIIARMDSRPKHGERLRSNIHNPNQDFKDTPAPSSDEVVTSLIFDGTDGLPAWMHLGGIQIVDDVLVIPMERTYPQDSETGSLVFLELLDPENPFVLSEFHLNYRVGVVAITRDPASGKYLIVASGGDTQTLAWYESVGTDLRDPNLSFSLLDVWNVNDFDVAQTTSDAWEKWQTFGFIRQSDGGLFLGTTDNTSAFDDEDDSNVASLFHISRVGNAFSLQFIDTKKLKLDDPRTGNAAASGGYHVTPTGQLILYMGEHQSSGPDESIRCGELRSIDVSSSGTDPSGNKWIEFYNDNTGWDSDSPDKSMIFDRVDFGREDWVDLDREDGWGDEPDSLRFFAPVGEEILLFVDQGWSGQGFRLVGTGTVDEISVLDDISFGDQIHSVFAGDYPLPVGLPVDVGLVNLQTIVNAYAFEHSVDSELGLVLEPGAWVGSSADWIAPGSKDVLIRAQTNRSTLILAP